MIRLGAQWCPSSCGFNDYTMCKAMKEVGFHSVDYSLMDPYNAPLWQLSDSELRIKMESTRKIINDSGLVVGQTHSPVDGYWETDISTKEQRWHAQVQAIKAAAFLGSPYIVIHPLTLPFRVTKETYEESKAINMEYYNFLKPYLEEYDVKCAIENLFSYNPILMRNCKTACSTAKSLIDYVDSLHSDRFVVCLDVGHAVLAEQDPVEMIYALGKDYLQVTHIHDNCYRFDDHVMPGMGKIDWVSVGWALNDIQFDGIFSFESLRPYFTLGDYAKELAYEFLHLSAELGKAITNVK